MTEVSTYSTCRRQLAEDGFTIDANDSALKMVPLAKVDEDASYAYSDLVEMLLELDDVDTVYTK